MEEVSYDQLIDEFVEARKDESQTIWRQSAIAYFLQHHMAVPAKTIASDIGLTGRRVSQMSRTFECFPEESDRAQDMSFSIHQICAETDDPVGWLDKAVKNAWSVRELKRVIKEGSPEPDPVEQAGKLWDKVLTMIGEGGPAAEYIETQIKNYQEVEASGRDADPQARQEAQEEAFRV